MFSHLKQMYVGYWKETHGDSLPVPVENTATDEQIEEMLKAAECFKTFTISRHYKGSSQCRICNCENGSIEFSYVKRGKILSMPIGIFHYIKDHRVLIPELLKLDEIVKSIK